MNVQDINSLIFLHMQRRGEGSVRPCRQARRPGVEGSDRETAPRITGRALRAARTGIASVTAKIAIPERSLGEARTQRSGDERLGRGPASRTAAASILQDVPLIADRRDGPIAEGRHSLELADCRAGDDAPARAVPVLNRETAGPNVVGGDGRDRRQADGGVRLRVRAGDGAPECAVPVLDGRVGAASVVRDP